MRLQSFAFFGQAARSARSAPRRRGRRAPADRGTSLVRKSVHVASFGQRALGDGLEPLHEQIGNPVRRVHVVRAAAVVAGLLAQVEEVLDVGVPELEVRAERAGPLAALVHGDGDVVADLQKRDHARAFAVRAVNVRAVAADRRPRAAEAARPFREVRKASPRLGDFLDAIAAIEQVAGRELRVHACRH